MHCYNYAFLNKCSTAPMPNRISFSIGVLVEREKQTSKKQLILSSLWKPHSLKQPNSMLLRKKKGGGESERRGRVLRKWPKIQQERTWFITARELWPHRAPWTIIQYTISECLGYFIADVRSVAATVEMLSSLSTKEITDATGSPGEGSQILTSTGISLPGTGPI